MKKFFFTLISFGIFWTFTTNAQNFEFETIRTENAPGFFMLRIFPLEGNTTMEVRPIYVKNFSKADEKLYEELTPFIQELKGVIIEKEDLKFYTQDPQNKIVFLGEKEKGFLNFKIQNSENALLRFQNFQKEHFENIVLRNIEMNFGGNIYDVLPSTIPDIGEKPITIIGKFRKEMKTRIEIKGEIAEGYIQSIEPLNIQDKELSKNSIASQLPDLWEEIWKRENPPPLEPKKEAIDWLQWNNFFPILLFLLGIFCFVIAVKSIKKNYDPLLDVKEFDIQDDQKAQQIPLKEAKKQSKKKKKPISKKTTAKAPASTSSRFVDMPQIQSDEKK